MLRFRHAFAYINTFPSAFWVVIIATFINQTGNMASVFLILYLNQYVGLSLPQSSFAFAMLSLSMLIAGLFGGSLVDKFGAVRIMMSSLFANGLILVIFSHMHAYSIILIMCLLWGFFFGLYRPASQTFISYLSVTGMHKITFSIYRLVLNLGLSIGPAMGGFLASHSFRSIFIVNGIANLLASLILFTGLIKTAWFTYRPALQRKMEISIKWLKRDTSLCLFVIGMVPVLMVFFQCGSTLAIFLKRDLHLGLSFYGFLFTLNTLIIVFCELPINIVTMHWPYRINFMLGSLFIILGFSGLYFVTLEWHILVLAVLWTIGEMILYPSSSSYIAEIAPAEHRGSYMSVSATCSNLAMLFGPWGGSIVMAQLGAHSLWIICGFWGGISVIIFHYLSEPI